MPRVVSLIASATEIVCALGGEEQLVGRSHECDDPPSVRRLPVCTAPMIDPRRPSAEIDRQVKAVGRTALSVYRVHADLLAHLQPDVVITQSQCAVCAVSLPDVERALGAWIGSRPRLVSLEPHALADVWADIRSVAAVLGLPDRGIALIDACQTRIDVIAARAQELSARPTVACLAWLDPLMAAGNWVPELVALAGGTNLFGEAGKHAPGMSWNELIGRDPDVIVILPCGFDIPRLRRELSGLARPPQWLALRAVRNGRVYLTDGHQYFNRPGPRLVESLEILAELLHPEAFCFGHEGVGWARMAEVPGWT